MATKLLYQGHGSYRITTADGKIIYIDPYIGEGYDKLADILLVSHQHPDHNKVELVTKKPGCAVITNVEALAGGIHNIFNIDGVLIEAVEACNANHDPKECVGFMLTVDDIKLYFAADTSKTSSMESYAKRHLDYAFLPIDGSYNMDVNEAIECATLIGARINIPVHMSPGNLFDKDIAETFDAPGKRVVAAGVEFDL